MPELAPVSAPSGFRGQSASERVQGTGKPDGAAHPGPGTTGERGSDGVELSPEALRLLEKLKATDARVRAHEAAHLAAAGGLAKGGASFTYQRGPDGKQYAVGGEVSIDTSAIPGDPRASLARAQQVQAAALAPSDPSPQDRSVAAAAAAQAAKALGELARQGTEGNSRNKGGENDEAAKGLRWDLSV